MEKTSIKTVPLKPKMEGLFSPRSPIEFIGFAAVNAIIGLVSAGNLLALLFVPALAGIWYLYDRRRMRQKVASTRFPVDREPPNPSKGLILLLSPYSTFDVELKCNRTQLQQAMQHICDTDSAQLTDADFDTIGLQNSNLQPQIKAIQYHLAPGVLRDVWLLTTQSYDDEQMSGEITEYRRVDGSDTAAMILKKYLERQPDTVRYTIHSGSDFSVKEWDYSQIWQLAEQIFRTSGYKNEVMIADITGGTKMMSIALAMACLPPKRRMQYMDAERDWQGNPQPQGKLSPVMIDIDPIVEDLTD